MVRAKVHTSVRPSLHMVVEGDSAAGAMIPSDREELGKRLSAVYAWLVNALADVEVVRAAVALEGALGVQAGARVVVAEGFDDVVLDQGAARPAVQAEVAVALGVELAGPGDDSVCCLLGILFLEGGRRVTYLSLLPGFQPLPETKLPVSCLDEQS